MFVIVTNVTLLFVVILDKIPENNQQKMLIFVFYELFVLIRYTMRTILIDLSTKQTTIFTVKTDLSKKINVSASTLLRWSKEGIKQTKEYIICFDATEYKNKSKVRKHGF